MSEVMTKKGLAEFLKVSVTTIDRLIKRGMPFIHAGGHKRFESDKVLGWMRTITKQDNEKPDK